MFTSTYICYKNNDDEYIRRILVIDRYNISPTFYLFFFPFKYLFCSYIKKYRSRPGHHQLHLHKHNQDFLWHGACKTGQIYLTSSSCFIIMIKNICKKFIYIFSISNILMLKFSITDKSHLIFWWRIEPKDKKCHVHSSAAICTKHTLLKARDIILRY